MKITVYSKNICPNCDKTKSNLDSQGFEFETKPLFEDKFDRVPSENFVYVKEKGFMAAPVVEITDDEGETLDMWAGHREDKLNNISNIDESSVW